MNLTRLSKTYCNSGSVSTDELQAKQHPRSVATDNLLTETGRRCLFLLIKMINDDRIVKTSK